MTHTFTEAELGALSSVLGAAIADQHDYLQVGNPRSDYDNEWPEVAQGKAIAFMAMSTLCEHLGFKDHAKSFEGLAENFSASGREYAEMYSDEIEAEVKPI